MAPPTKTNYGRKGKERAVLLKAKLDAICCPNIDGMDDELVAELIFTPGEHRLRLLEWLFGKVNSKLSAFIESEAKHHSMGVQDWRVKHMFSLACAFGLCSLNDVDIIQGSASEERQASFYDKLLKIVVVLDEAQPAAASALPFGSVSLRSQYKRHSALLSQLLIQNVKTPAFTSSAIGLLPLDLTRLVEANWREKRWKPGDKQPLPVRADLANQISKLEQQLADMKHSLASIEPAEAGFDEAMDEKSLECLRSRHQVVVSSLAQILTDLSYSFSNDFEPWCNIAEGDSGGEDANHGSQNQGSKLGFSIKRADNLLTGLSNLLDQFRSIATLPTALEGLYSEEVEDKLKELKECIDVLRPGQNSLQGITI